MAPPTPRLRAAAAAASLLLLVGGPLAVGASRTVGASRAAGALSSESAGECRCGRRRCSCSAFLREAGFDLRGRAGEFCPKAMKAEGRLGSRGDVSKYGWGQRISQGYFDTFKGMINRGDAMESEKCLQPGSCFPEVYAACAEHYGCKLADAPEGAWGLCGNVFASKDWSMEEAALQLFRSSQGQLWCSEEAIEGFCGKTKAEIPEFPNACSRALGDLEGRAATACPEIFKYEGPEVQEFKGSAAAAAPAQFREAAPAMMGLAKHMERKKQLPQGTCYPWLLHVCEGHYQKKGCELGDDLKPKVCERVFASKVMSVERALVALYHEGGLWCSEQALRRACDQE